MQFYVKSKKDKQGISVDDVILALEILQMNGEVKVLVVTPAKDLWWLDYTEVSFVGIANPDAIVYHETKPVQMTVVPGIGEEQLIASVPMPKKPFGRK